MSKLFCGENIKRFFEMLHRPVTSVEQLQETFGQAIAHVAQDLNIGKVVIEHQGIQSKLGAQTNALVCILYQKEEAVSHKATELFFENDDIGDTVLTFYAIEGYQWNDQELQEIHIIGNQIFAVFNQRIVSGILKNAKVTDLLVDIPNLSGFLKVAEKKFAQGKLEQYDIVYLNISNFNYVNTVLSHVQGDEVLKIYAGMLAGILEKDETIARLGGDNFVALIRTENTKGFIEFISSVDVTYPYEDKEKRFHFGATIGVGKLGDVKGMEEMMYRACISYQVARQRKAVEAVYYNDELRKEISNQKEILSGFQQALMEQEFLVYYQPKVTLADKRICGAEALVRWKRDACILKPAQFISILEKDGSICKLDFYVLDKVCAMLDKCRKKALPLTKISVNFSRKHLENPELVNEIVAVVDKYQVPHECLEIELTESEDFADYEVMSRLVNDLKAVNISTSIDDFGSGYSTLNMLKMIDIDLLKIDKSIVPLEANSPDEEKDIIMFENVAHLAKDLGLKIVAEGVETKQQFDYLFQTGCDMIQGFYFDKALPEETFLERISVGHY